ncbi:hypothetical protein [Arenimonas sp.]|uniref:hypothetical protein n=1 Tax=Arenimonas sp. TaxID=1872635 RepID=UPI002E30418D|nr:hypothetical protein [Arenimonas sp.]HEX4853057.1 hypothetical protein [Arenimonas sp.]
MTSNGNTNDNRKQPEDKKTVWVFTLKTVMVGACTIYRYYRLFKRAYDYLAEFFS